MRLSVSLGYRALALCMAACCAQAQTAREPELPPLLQDVAQRVQGVLDVLDTSMKEAASRLAETGIDTDAAREVLRGLLAAHPYAVDACTVNPWGRIVAAEPDAYRHIEGANIRRQEQIRRMYQTHRPVMSLVIDTVEGFRAVDVEYPVFNADEMLMGSVSVLIRHETFLEEIIRPAVQGFPTEIWVMQADGLVLYGSDRELVGVNALTDDRYQARGPLLGVIQRVSRESSGTATYALENPSQVDRTTRTLHWTTVSLFGTPWRLSLVQVVAGSPEAAKGEFGDLQLMFARDALRRLCAGSLARAYMHGDNTVGMRRLLEGFHKDHPQLYSVQWLDGEAVTRFGVPASNSLRDFEHASSTDPVDQEIANALKTGQEHWLVATLREGQRGIMYLCPVRSGNTTLGMLYFISLLDTQSEGIAALQDMQSLLAK